MARAARVVKDQLLPKLQQLYRGQPVPYQQVDEVEINNNYYQNNNYSNVNNNNLLELPAPSSPGLRRWQRWSRNVVGLNGLFIPTPRKGNFISLKNELLPVEVGVLQVALVTLGRHIGLLNNWYCLPEENEIPTDSVLFPLSTYITGFLATLAADLSQLGAWCQMPSWWYNLEMRQLRLRQDIKGLYLYDLHTDEQMLVYKPDTVTMHCEFTKASTIASRLEVWIL